jgi:hypothetical protein
LVHQLADEVQAIRAQHPEAAIQAARESRLLRVIEHVILKETLPAIEAA